MDRDELLARHRAVHTTIEQRDWDDPGSDLEELSRLVDERLALWDAYRALLTLHAVSRCPLTDEVVHLDVDLAGVDGLWWNADAPVRGALRPRPTLVGLTGAVDLWEAEDDLPETPFPLRLGPDRPYLVRSLLSDPEVVAVVSGLRVGPLDAFLVAYFRPPRHRGAPFEHELWSGPTPVAGDRDVDLEASIEADRVLWIAPGDDALRLRGGAVGCPFIDRTGDDRDALVFEGVLWRLDDDADDARVEAGS